MFKQRMIKLVHLLLMFPASFSKKLQIERFIHLFYFIFRASFHVLIVHGFWRDCFDLIKVIVDGICKVYLFFFSVETHATNCFENKPRGNAPDACLLVFVKGSISTCILKCNGISSVLPIFSEPLSFIRTILNGNLSIPPTNNVFSEFNELLFRRRLY